MDWIGIEKQIGKKAVYFVKVMILVFILLPYVGIPNFRYIVGKHGYAFISDTVFLLYKVNTVIIFLYILFQAVGRKVQITKTCLLICVLYGYCIVRLFFAFSEISFKNLITVITMVLFCNFYLFKDEQNIVVFTDAMNCYLVSNLLSIIALWNTKGMVFWSVRQSRYWHNYYLLGYDNGFIILISLALCLNLIMILSQRKARFFVSFICCFVTGILIKSGATIAALLVFLALWVLFSKFKGSIAVLSPPVVFGGACISFLLVVVLRQVRLVNYFAERFFYKNLNNTRADLWNAGFEKIIIHPIIGHGYNVAEIGRGYASPHNMILEWLLQGGIIQLILETVLIFYVLRKLYTNIESEYARIVYASIIAFFTAYMIEGYSTYQYYWEFLALMLIGGNILDFNNLLTCNTRRKIRIVW